MRESLLLVSPYGQKSRNPSDKYTVCKHLVGSTEPAGRRCGSNIAEYSYATYTSRRIARSCNTNSRLLTKQQLFALQERATHVSLDATFIGGG